jgi:O-antigen ligase
MWIDKPLFGWGFDSFDDLLPFYGSDFLISQNYDRAGSDLLQALAELGLIGTLLPIMVLGILLVRYFRGKCNIQLTNHFLIGCGAVLLMGLVDSPFMSPAVHLSFFIILFSGLRWADLSRNNADEVDAPSPPLVTSKSLRKVPFYQKRQKDRSLP